MRSSTSYDESVVGFLSNKCELLDLKLSFKFPSEDEFSRLLRLNGYKRMIDGKHEVLILNADALGFKSLIESIVEDWLSLCPEIVAFAFENPADSAVGFSHSVGRILSDVDSAVTELNKDVEFISFEEFRNGKESAVLTSFERLETAFREFTERTAYIRRLLTMSSLSNNPPAAGRGSINELIGRMHSRYKAISREAEVFRKQAEGSIEKDWLDISLKSYLLTAEEELVTVENRLRQYGLLN